MDDDSLEIDIWNQLKELDQDKVISLLTKFEELNTLTSIDTIVH